MVYAYKYFKRLAFMDFEANTVRTVNFSEKEPKNGDEIAMLAPENVTHYWGMSGQDRYVYVLHSGRSPVDVSMELKKGPGHIDVEKFDWNGNPVRKYRLDHWGYFCVDEKAKRIYMLSGIEDDPFWVYTIPD
jgi:hypothetical protein